MQITWFLAWFVIDQVIKFAFARTGKIPCHKCLWQGANQEYRCITYSALLQNTTCKNTNPSLGKIWNWEGRNAAMPKSRALFRPKRHKHFTAPRSLCNLRECSNAHAFQDPCLCGKMHFTLSHYSDKLLAIVQATSILFGLSVYGAINLRQRSSFRDYFPKDSNEQYIWHKALKHLGTFQQQAT